MNKYNVGIDIRYISYFKYLRCIVILFVDEILLLNNCSAKRLLNKNKGIRGICRAQIPTIYPI